MRRFGRLLHLPQTSFTRAAVFKHYVKLVFRALQPQLFTARAPPEHLLSGQLQRRNVRVRRALRN